MSSILFKVMQLKHEIMYLSETFQHIKLHLDTSKMVNVFIL